MERDGDGEKTILRAWWRPSAVVRVLVVSVVVVWVRVSVFRGCKVARLGGCKVASTATFKAYLCTSFVVV